MKGETTNVVTLPNRTKSSINTNVIEIPDDSTPREGSCTYTKNVYWVIILAGFVVIGFLCILCYISLHTSDDYVNQMIPGQPLSLEEYNICKEIEQRLSGKEKNLFPR